MVAESNAKEKGALMREGEKRKAGSMRWLRELARDHRSCTSIF